MTYVYLLSGLAILVVAGEILVRGAVAIAGRLKIAPLLVGLTIVALGTSAPELTVSIDAALRGVPDLVTGNVVGSNISNILLVLGAAAIITPVVAHEKIVRRDVLFLVVVSSVLAGLCFVGVISPATGAVFLLVYAGYAFVSYRAEKRALPAVDTAGELASAEVKEHGGVPENLMIAVPVFVGGCIGVVLGADLLVEGAVRLARVFDVSEAVVGLSILAVGTSLPELAISVIAAIRGHSDVALGNVVGSNISNVLVVLGGAALFGPIEVADQIAKFDIWVMIAATVVLLPTLASGWRLTRTEAALFLAAYAVYIFALFAGWPAAVAEMI